MVVVDFRRSNGHEPFAAYEDFGVRCCDRLPDRVLLWAGEGEADIHYTLVDVLLTVARIVRTPLGMKLAVVTPFGSVAQVARAMQRELLGVGCDLRVFGSESEAMRWLEAGAPLAPAPAPLDAEERQAA